jgi:hypothetical protein
MCWWMVNGLGLLLASCVSVVCNRMVLYDCVIIFALPIRVSPFLRYFSGLIVDSFPGAFILVC